MTQQKQQGFQCKQFFVAHDQCAMKVGTDSLLLGSWCDVETSTSILDIGSGSGILSLMLAQKSADNAQIIGIDIDELAVNQANQNAQNTLWHERLTFTQADAKTFETDVAFDCIVSNPPYFEVATSQSIQMTPSRRRARQNSALSHEQIISIVNTHLSPQGSFYLILPHESVNGLEEAASEFGFICTRRLKIRSRDNTPFIRQCLCFAYDSAGKRADSVLTIYDNKKQYTKAYRALCKDYYLAF